MGAIFQIIYFTRRFWKWYLFMGLFVIMISTLSLVIPLLSKQIVDIIVQQISGKQADFSPIAGILLIVISTDILITTLTAFSQWIGDILTSKLYTFLSRSFYQHILNLHIGYYDNEITGQIVNRMYRGITSITDFIQNMLNNFLPFFLTAIVTIVLMARYSLTIALLLLILFPIYILISHGSTVIWRDFEEKKNQLNDASQGRVFESISGIRIVKSFAAEVSELRAFLDTREKIENLAVSQSKRWHLYDFGRRLSLNLILFLIFAYVVYNTFHGKYTLGEMTLLLQLANQARFPLFAMSFILGQIQMAGAGSADFFRVLDTKNKVVDSKNAKTLSLKTGVTKIHRSLIEFRHVSFTYGGNKKVLADINFLIYPGEKLALVGESGEGKSTIVNLLLRYYDPEFGQILINNQDISTLSQASLHQNIAVVFQESLLFSGTIKENIHYGKPDATDEEIVGAAIAANAHEFIEKLPDKYQSVIGERGVKLSGGQKQRIAIARAILKDAPIIILDEATSSLDSKSEIEMQKGLNRLLTKRTSIIIAHRLSTISQASHILVIAGGTVAEYGTSRELLGRKNGLYRELVDLQRQLLRSPREEKKSKLEKFDLVG